jgi:hypothetical protein
MIIVSDVDEDLGKPNTTTPPSSLIIQFDKPHYTCKKLPEQTPPTSYDFYNT